MYIDPSCLRALWGVIMVASEVQSFGESAQTSVVNKCKDKLIETYGAGAGEMLKELLL